MFVYRLLLGKRFVACLTLAFVFSVSQNAFSQMRFETPPDQISVRAGRPVAPNDAPGLKVSDFLTGPTQPVADGDVDPAFSPTFDSAYGTVYAIEELPDGRILVGGNFKSVNGVASPGIVRFNADRSIDTSFTPAFIRGTVFRIIVQADGKILIGGSFYVFNGSVSRFGIARLNSDGSLDTAFNPGSGPDSLVRDMVQQPDGRVIIGGDFISVNGISRWGVARLNADGSLDSLFTSPLTPTPAFTGGGVSAVGLQADGRVILGGSMTMNFGAQYHWVLRLQTNGAHDPTFSSPTMNSNPWELAVQPDGKIVLVGFFTTVSSTSRARIARLNADGTHDLGFNPGTGASSSALFVRMIANGKILVSGSFASINGTPRGGLAQLNPDGSLDGGFAPNGTTLGTVYNVNSLTSGRYFAGGTFSRISGADRKTLASLDSSGLVDLDFTVESLNLASIRTAIAQPDGRMIIGGFFNRLNGTPTNCVVRLTPAGTVDPTFSSGVSITGFVTKLIAQPDGKFLVIGSSLRINNGISQTIVRLNSDGSHDPSFAIAAIPQLTFGYTAAVQSDGKILYSYGTSSTDPAINSGFVRLNSNGSLDATIFIGRPIEAIAVLPNGQIIAGGSFNFSYVNSTTGTVEPHNGVIRLNADGSHDRTFQSGFTSDPNSTAVYAVHVQADGKIIAGGRLNVAGSPNPTGVARLESNGTLDNTFLRTPITSLFGIANVFCLHPTANGKILASGYFNDYGGPGRSNVVRLDGNGAVDQTFVASTDSTVSVVTTEATGSILIGGNFEKVNGITRIGLGRLLTESSAGDSAPFDFDGDGKTDIGIFRPAMGEWWISRSSDGQVPALQFGNSSDRIAPADYTGDGKTDIAFYRPSSGEWYILRSENNSFFSIPFGSSDDIPAPGDYDADGKADLAVFRPSSATWYIQRSGDNGTTIAQFGATGDQPVAADYDGDGRADLAIYRPSNGQWWLNRSTGGVIVHPFGNSNDKSVQGDYTGDGKADVAFWRPSTGEWYILRSEDLSYYSVPFGTTGDTPAPGDYDGDGKFDTTVFRPSNTVWYSNRTTAGILIQQFGATGDRPIPNAFVR